MSREVIGAEEYQRVLLELAALDKWDFTQSLRCILRVDSETLDVERINFWVLRDDPVSICCEEGFIRTGTVYDAGQLLHEKDYPRYFAALREEKVIAAGDVFGDPRTVELVDYLPRLGIGAMLDVPVWSGGRLAGVLCHEHVGGPRCWSEGEKAFAITMAQAVANTLEVRERRRSEEALRVAEAEQLRLAAAEQLARDQILARDQFLSVASHELYTPITSLKLAVDTLRATGPAEDAAQKRLALIDRQVARLSQLISTLLDVSRVQAGRLERRPVQVDLSELAAEAADRFQELMARNACQLALEAPEPVIGWWDRGQLDQVFTNLLSNALKFAAGGPVVVTIDRDGDRARVMVRDQGIGIPTDKLPHIFNRFERAVSTRSYGGLGLGLFIVRAIVEAHGGRVSIESEEGRGTTVMVELPITEPSEAEAGTPA